MLRIIRATTSTHFQQALVLIEEMARWDAEQSRLIGLDGEAVVSFFYPGKALDAVVRESAPPEGCLLLAGSASDAVACGAFHHLEPGTCELMHVWVRPEHRGRGTARRIVEELMQVAAADGYTRMRLETATFMSEARKLYASLGFQVRDPYREIPPAFLPFTICMEKQIK
jgi:ribosomal protein S18 acetylase RimI-like enzyme